MQILHELKKIHHQITVPAAILMALKAKIEYKRNIENRIGKVFEDGNKGVLIIGKAGTSKTRSMKKIFEGLGLDTINKHGKQIGKWFDSAGASTAIGIYETLEIYNDSIVFLDEFSMDTPAHLHILKQVANGKIMRQKHGSIEEYPFSGLLVCATNAINLPGCNNLEHLLAVLDRFYVVRAKSPQIAPNDYLDIVLSDTSSDNVDWNIIKNALVKDNRSALNEKEQALLRRMWEKKTREILDPLRAQYRNCWTAHDIMLFVKRFLDIEDITKSKEAIILISNMINDIVLFNPVGILWLRPLEETIYTTISSKETVTLQEIISSCETSGLSISVRHIHNVLNKLINNRIIFRSKHGCYSIKRTLNKSQQNQSNVMAEVL